jgi:phosphoenolpyruvate-protein phosphotransferase (PTS system enzyme I)
MEQGVVGLLSGTGNCIGYGIGRAKIQAGQDRTIQKKHIENPQAELARFDAAYEMTRQTVQALLEREIEDTQSDGEKIFETHLAFLEDPGFVDTIREMIESESVNAEWAVREVGEHLAQILSQVDSELIKERSADIRDLYVTMLDQLSGESGAQSAPLTDATQRVVLVMEELVPSFVIRINKDEVAAIVSEKGNITSHAAILAKLKCIPAIVGVKGLLAAVSEGDLMLVDTFVGEVQVNPDESSRVKIARASEQYEADRCACDAEKAANALTTDGTRIVIEANIGTPQEAGPADEACAEGIGLFRSEFLFMERNTLPDEEEQFRAYREAAEKMAGREVVIRTMDIGGDKPVPSLNLPAEQNPFLGLRAIRLSLQRKDLFLTQLRAILRASAFGDIAIMFPMISSMEELHEAKAMVQLAKAELDVERRAYNHEIKIGMMVEIPATVTLSDLFAREVDFFSIGTNDLIQYSLAADRLNQAVAPLYTPYHPAILRQIALVAQNGHLSGIHTAICGEAASDPLLQPLFVGFGIDRLSMSASLIPMAKRTIRQCRDYACKDLARRVLALSSATLVKQELLAFQQEQQG